MTKVQVKLHFVNFFFFFWNGLFNFSLNYLVFDPHGNVATIRERKNNAIRLCGKQRIKAVYVILYFFLLQEDAKQHIENYCLLLADAYYFIIKVN